MLMHPYLDIPYDPKLKHFLGGFDIYDREETLGAELAEYDPECPLDRERLISRFVVTRFAGLSHRHKFVLLSVLSEALAGDESVFFTVLKHDPLSRSLLPIGWGEMQDPKIFFRDIYIKLSEVWEEELYVADQEGFSAW
ncbi:hypothetical protein [Pseudomonas atagonensis]|uniref:hypothetical protein n=1 Tax=Pseudomonas atagonensis TaxID=2609964 RepID=UPI00140CD287|nr:hypothetical protein [Pseudomonas atagonensis]